MTFTAVVVDDRGRPVTDLRRDEIVLLEDDRPRDVAFFEFVGSAAPAPSAAPSSGPADVFTNRFDRAAGAPRHLIAIVLDLVNTPVANQADLQTRFLHQLKQLPANAQVGLYVLGNQAVAVHDYTHDVGALRSRLERGQIDIYTRALESTRDASALAEAARPEQRESLSGFAESTARSARELNSQELLRRMERTLAGLRSVARHMAGVPGRKSVVWMSEGFPLMDQLETSYAAVVRETGQQLATDDVALYPVDPAGVRSSALHGGGLGIDDQGDKSTKGQRFPSDTVMITKTNRAAAVSTGRLQGTSVLMADLTGGVVSRNSNDLTAGLTAAANDIRGTYALGFYPAAEPDNLWHPVTVRVIRPGVTVRHRAGYVAMSATIDQTRDWDEAAWADVAQHPLGSSALKIDARVTRNDNTLQTLIHLQSDELYLLERGGTWSGEVDVALVERDARGPVNVRVQTASVEIPLNTAATGAVPIESEFSLRPNTVSVRLIVRDKGTGQYGSVDIPLEKVREK